ncbi:MAG: aminotransferase class I/II-fold pyridoxal phosphate-dependent enzyme [Deltaproteobacteria bacterium]
MRKRFGQTQYFSFAWVWILIIAACLLSCNEQNVTGAAQQGPAQLSLNESPFGPAQGVTLSILKEIPNLARYAAGDGEAFVRKVAAHEGVEADQIIPGEILDLLGIHLGLKGGPGGEFIYSVPGYPVLVNAAAGVGGVVISVPLTANLENDLAAMEAQVNDRTQAVFLVNPHNPSGTVSDKTVLRDFIKRVSSRTLVIVDEAYLEYTDDFAGRTAVNQLKEGDNVMVFRTMAKAYGMAGLSTGYAIAPKPLAQYLRGKGLGDSLALNRLSIAACEAALTDQAHIARVNQQVSRERNKWHAVLDGLGLRHTASSANFVFFDSGRPHAEVQEKLRQAGIIIGRSFAPYDTWIRITIGTPDENARAQAAIRSIVQPLQSGR